MLFRQTAPATYCATDMTCGPWTSEAQHGSAPAALLLHVLEALSTLTPMRVAGVTVELLHPVPIQTLEVAARVEREGKRVQYSSASLFATGIEVARANCWRVATGTALVPSDPVSLIERQPIGSEEPHGDPALGPGGFHSSAVEVDVVSGGLGASGPGEAWIRLLVPIVDDLEVTAAQRAMVAADFGNGVGSLVAPDKVSFINPDVTMYLARVPEGEWIGLSSHTIAGGDAIGTAHSTMSDAIGVFGFGTQIVTFRAV